MAHHYGWRADQPDARDYLYSAPEYIAQSLPSKVDLSPQCPQVYQQGALGSCTSNAIAAAYEFDRMKQGLPDFMPSRLFLYYNERAMEGTVSYDSGAAIRDGIKSLASQGICPETEWPYNIAKFAQKPPKKCYTDAKKDVAVKYARVSRSLQQMKACLASGYPFVYGFTVYESFESNEVAQTGVVPMPGPDESVLGGHAVMCCGFDDEQQRFLVQNSWGSDWGMQGRFTMPYEYLTNHGLASDFWTIRLVQ